MNHPKTHLAAILFAATIFILSAGNAAAEDDPLQVLDRVTAIGNNFAHESLSHDPDRVYDFSMLLGGVDLPAGTNLVDCTVGTTGGLFCIDRKDIVNWPDIHSNAGTTLFNCEDSALGLDEKKENTCTAFARNAQGVFILGGKRNGKSNVVERILDSDHADCGEPGYTTFDTSSDGDSDPDYCVAVLADGRPLIQDIDIIEGDLADEFAGEEVLLVLEERKTLLRYSQIGATDGPTQTDVIASGKNDWNLIGNELLLNATLLPEDANFYALAATTKGRILAVNADINSSDTGFEVFDFAGHRGSAAQCAPGNESFDVTVSEKTGLVYVIDTEYCLMHVLEPVLDEVNFNPFTLEIAQETDPDTMIKTDLTLSTNDVDPDSNMTTMPVRTVFPPLLVNVTPGIVVDLSLCGVACTPVTASNGDPGLTMREVNLGGSPETTMTLFQITGYPDCRWTALTCAELFDDYNDADMDGCEQSVPEEFLKCKGVIVEVDPAMPDHPAFWLLDLEKLLPAEIKALFPDGLPPLRMEASVRGAAQNGYFFDAFFGVTPDQLNFEGAYELEIDVEDLLIDSGTGTGLGCFLGLPQGTPLYADGTHPVGTLDWDVLTKVSEDYTTYTSNPPPGTGTGTGDRRPYAAAGQDNFETRTVNSGCINPARGRDGGWSMISYGLEITPWIAMRDEAGTGWVTSCDPDAMPAIDCDEDTFDEAVLAKHLLKHYRDFSDALNELACVANPDIDGASALAPIDSDTCSSINEVWANGLDKLLKGLEATLFPKTSQGNENLGAFEAKLAQLRDIVENYLPPTPSMRPDLANRKGELEARLLTVEHIYEERFKPSITDDGFGGTGEWIH